MSNQTWSTRCWVDGQATVHNVAWESNEEAMEQCQTAMDGTPFVAARSVLRLEIILTETFSSQMVREYIAHRWTGNTDGTFRHAIIDGTEII